MILAAMEAKIDRFTDPLKFFQPRENKPCELSEFDKLEADRERLLILTGMAALLYGQGLAPADHRRSNPVDPEF